jgi:membrane protein DedA with SNARE-associated domain
MERRQLGFGFCCISAFLFSSNYISAAIWGSSVTTWDYGLFHVIMDSIGSSLVTFSQISLVIGIAYIIWGEVEIILKIQKNSKKSQ